MKTLLTIIRREYLQRVRSRWFLVSTFGAPVFFIGIAVVPIILEMGREEARRSIALIDEIIDKPEFEHNNERLHTNRKFFEDKYPDLEKAKTNEDVPSSETEDSAAGETPPSTIKEA